MKKLICLAVMALVGSTSFAQTKAIPDQTNPSKAQSKIQDIDQLTLKKIQKSHAVPSSTSVAPSSTTSVPGSQAQQPDDGRNLPLNDRGKLISVDGYEVNFEVPDNPNDPGICGTMSPYIREADDLNRAGCPFVVPCDNPNNRDTTTSNGVLYFMLRWTIVRDGGASTNIDSARVEALMTELNNDFAAYNMVFCRETINFVEDATYYNLNVGSEDSGLKNTYGANPGQVINIYVVNQISNPSAGGYARFPYDPFGGYNIRGGVVMGRSNSNIGTHTLAHELGHTFGLEHTFHGVDEVTPCSACYEGNDNSPIAGASVGGDTEGDWCQDTNPHPTNSYVCGDQGTDGCAPGNPWQNSPVDNHMSYSFCTSTFSAQQHRRMRCMIYSYLSQWTAYGGGTCGNQPPVAEFTGTPLYGTAPHSVTYTDLSAPSSVITSWSWDFDVTGLGGVTPATFNGQTPPVVVYNNPGIYTVELTITSANGNDTETKTAYVEVISPPNTCDTLDTQWNTPTPNPTFYQFGPGDLVTGVPSATLMANPTDAMECCERFASAGPGTTVGGVRIGLGNYYDVDTNTTIDIFVWDDNAGEPDWLAAPTNGGYLGGRTGINPGSDIGVPGPGFFAEVWVPFFNEVAIPNNFFHVGININPGDGNDTLIVVSSQDGQGEGDNSNHVWTTNFGTLSYQNDVGLDFDLDIVPMLNEYTPLPIAIDYQETPVCDTTYAMLVDTVYYTDWTNLNSLTYNFSDGQVFQFDNIPANGIPDIQVTDTVNLVFTQPGPVDFTITAVSEDCGRVDSTEYTLNYTFNQSPSADFSMSNSNPVCEGDVVNFTGTPGGMSDYTWDFGDGTVASSGASATTTHTYTTSGLYYVTLTITDANGCTSTIQRWDYVEVVNCSVPPPVADFSMDVNSGCTPLTVNFTDLSANSPTSWVWDFGDGNFSTQQNPTHTFTSAGTYNVTLFATNTGGTDQVTYVVTVDDPADATFSFADFCEGSANGPTGIVTPGGTFSFNPAPGDGATINASTGVISNGVGGTTYGVEYTVVNGVCSNSSIVNVTVNALDDASFTFNDYCDGAANGPTGIATPGGTFSFNPAPGDGATINGSTGVISNGVAGNSYTVEYTTSGTCPSSSTQTVSVIPIEDASFTFNDFCEGSANGPTAIATSGGTWAFNPAPGDGATINSSTGEISNEVGGNSYTVEYTTSGTCPGTSTVTVNVIPLDDASFTFNDFCVTGSNGPTGIATPGGSFAFNPAPGDGASINNSTGVISNPVAGNSYTVEYTTSGPCPNSSTVTVNAVGVSYTSTVQDENCGASDGEISLTASGGFGSPYQYSIDGGSTFQGSGTFTGLTAGSYNIVIEDASGCQTTGTVTVSTVSGPVISNPIVTDPTCNGDCDGSISVSVSGGTSPYTYTWTDGGGNPVGGNSPSITNLCAGNYNLEVTDASGSCSAFGSYTLTNPPAADPSFNFADYCEGSANGPTGVATPGGTWAFNPVPSDGATINSSTGEISNGVGGTTYTVEYTTPSPCPETSTQTVSVLPLDDASFNFPDYCEGSANGPTGVATPGGTFSFNPVPSDGATINGANGTISNGVGGTTYTVEYTTSGTCPNTSTVNVTVNPVDDPSFNFADYCEGAANGPTGIATPGGTFSFNPVPTDGATIDGSTGVISGGVGGTTYTVQYTTSGSCPGTSTVNVTVNTLDDPSFSFPDYCEGAANGPTGVATPGGTFSFNPVPTDGATIDGSTGVITGGVGGTSYTVEYTTSGACPNSTTVTVTVNPQDDATFTFNDFCVGAANGPTNVQTSGGTWSFNPVPTDGATINASTGQISNAVAGNSYTVEYTTSGVCPDTYSVTVNVTSQDDASFTFDDFCLGSSNGPTNIMTSGGTFAFNPVPTDGATIDPSTGVISNATGGSSYVVEYTTPAGPCQNSSTVTVTALLPEDASFNYSDSSFCQGDANPLPTILGTSGGSFSAPVGVSINTSTGEVNLSASSAGGPYSVQYITPGQCADTATFDIYILVPADSANAGSDVAVCDTIGVVTLGANDPGAASGIWSIVTGTAVITDPNDSSSTVTGLTTAGSVTLEWTINDACNTTSDQMTITIDECEEVDTEVSVPTAFTPDGDGTNDVWNIDNIDQYPEASVVVFNRWGNEVYRSEAPYEPWDGKYNDELLPTGSYYYIINLNDGSEPMSGAITIIK